MGIRSRPALARKQADLCGGSGQHSGWALKRQLRPRTRRDCRSRRPPAPALHDRVQTAPSPSRALSGSMLLHFDKHLAARHRDPCGMSTFALSQAASTATFGAMSSHTHLATRSASLTITSSCPLRQFRALLSRPSSVLDRRSPQEAQPRTRSRRAQKRARKKSEIVSSSEPRASSSTAKWL